MPAPDPAVREGLDLLFTRLHEAGEAGAAEDVTGARIDLLVKTLVGALGGSAKV